MMHHGVKAGGESPKTKSDIRHSDTYIVIGHLCKLCREMSFILVITGSSFSPVCVAKREEEGTYCRRSAVPRISSFPFSCSAHSG